jgi:hypothetical protein
MAVDLVKFSNFLVNLLRLAGSAFHFFLLPVFGDLSPLRHGETHRPGLSLHRLMDLKAVELLTEREFSLDKELRSIGVSNLISALCGMAIELVPRGEATNMVHTDRTLVHYFLSQT